VFASFSKVISNFFVATNQLNINSLIAIILFALNLILNLILVPVYGVPGAAISTVLVQVTSFVLKIVIFSRKNKLNINRILLLNSSDLSIVRNQVRKLK